MRSARLDNLKCLLIFCVVLGHLLELQEGAATDYLYLSIYTFHMPLFVWVSGYVARPADRSCLRSLAAPYLVFQLLYSLAAVLFWGNDEEVKLLEPYWLMWFLMALLIWRLLLPLFVAGTFRTRALTLLGTFVLSLLTGWSSELRYVLSFQRMVALLPVFLLGYYCRSYQTQVSDWWKRFGGKQRAAIRLCLALVVLAGLAVILYYYDQGEILRRWLYWKYPYGKRGGNALTRSCFTAYAVVWLAFVLTWIPGRPIPVLTKIGQNTLPVYLLHGFVIEALDHFGVYEPLGEPWLLTLALAAAMVFLFSRPAVGALFRDCFGTRSKGSIQYEYR